MISFDKDGHRFHLRAGALFFQEGRVLLHKTENDDFWALPGGRVNMGETAELALQREMLEELELPIEVNRLAWVVENFFTYADQNYHEVGLYFLCNAVPGKIPPGDTPFYGYEGSKRLIFQWFERTSEALGKLDLRPNFLANALLEPIEAHTHFVHDGRSGRYNSCCSTLTRARAAQ